MGFDKGAKAIEKQEKEEAAARKAAYSDRLDYLRLQNDETIFIRLLNPAEGEDAWIKVAMHNGVTPKPKPEGAKNWPKRMSAVCRYDKQIQSILGTTDCYICDNELPGFGDKFARPTTKVWSLAVERFRLLGDGSPELGGDEMRGRDLGMFDVQEEYDIKDADGKPTGKKGKRPRILVINQAWSNFFAALGHTSDVYGEIRDRDFVVRRTGDGTDTDYQTTPMKETPDLAPGTDAWKVYTDQLAEREISLDQIVLDLASDEHYARWFDPTKTVDKDGKIVPMIPSGAADVYTGATPTAPAAPAPDDERTKQMMADLQARLASGQPLTKPGA